MQGAVVNGIKRLQRRRDGMRIQNDFISNTEITVDCAGCYVIRTEEKNTFLSLESLPNGPHEP